MATKKIGIYRNYYGPIPKDSSGKPLPKNEWPKKRAHSWVVRWHGQDGQRFSKSLPTRKEADLFAEEKQADVRIGQGDPPPNTTLAEFGKMYMSIRSDLTERSRQEHARTVKLLKERIGKERPVNKITPLDARRFIAWYRERSPKDQPIAPATVNKLLRECRRIFREAVDCRLIRENPFNGIRQEKVSRNEWHHVTPEDYRKLIEAAPSLRWRGIIALAYCCGLRLSEILNLTWPDIDFEKEVVRVVAKRGKAGAEDWMPKDKDMRILPMPRPVTNVLTKVQAEAGDGQVYVFVVQGAQRRSADEAPEYLAGFPGDPPAGRRGPVLRARPAAELLHEPVQVGADPRGAGARRAQ